MIGPRIDAEQILILASKINSLTLWCWYQQHATIVKSSYCQETITSKYSQHFKIIYNICNKRIKFNGLGFFTVSNKRLVHVRFVHIVKHWKKKEAAATLKKCKLIGQQREVFNW